MIGREQALDQELPERRRDHRREGLRSLIILILLGAVFASVFVLMYSHAERDRERIRQAADKAERIPFRPPPPDSILVFEPAVKFLSQRGKPLRCEVAGGGGLPLKPIDIDSRGKFLIVNDAPFRTVVIDLEKRVEACRLPGKGSFSPDGTRIVSAGFDLIIWDLVAAKRLAVWKRAQGEPWFHSATFSPDGNYVTAVIHEPGQSEVWLLDVNNSHLMDRIRHPASYTVFAKDGAVFYSYYFGLAPMACWDARTGKLLKELPPLGMVLDTVRSLPEGPRVLGSHAGKYVALGDIATSKILHRFDAEGSVVGRLSWSGDGKLAAFRSPAPSGEVTIWNIPDRKKLGMLEIGDGWGCAFTPDGKSLLALDKNGVLQQWDLASMTKP
ncbi:MAG: hypothetical protein FJ271_23465 [Planctomycetes bacterium]|nr:hypothetical protein [Planctomycetota bacterium]